MFCVIYLLSSLNTSAPYTTASCLSPGPRRVRVGVGVGLGLGYLFCFSRSANPVVPAIRVFALSFTVSMGRDIVLS